MIGVYPLQRISSTQTANECAVEQLETLLAQADLGLADQSILNTLDSGYGSPSYLAPLHQYRNLVNNVRFRYAKKIWLPAKSSPDKDSTIGAPAVYGAQYYLLDDSRDKTYHRKGKAYQVHQSSIFEVAEDDYLEVNTQTASGRPLKVSIWRWNNLLIRTKSGYNMKDKPFDLIAVRVYDAQTTELVFGRTLFTTLHGQRKDEITTLQAFESYRHRYDIEVSIKFMKQKLMLEKYQTPDVQHFDNWLVVIMTAYWLLFQARNDVHYQPKKWQQYKKVNQRAATEQTQLTPSQVYQSAERFFLTFDSTPFLPKKCKKGKGRQKGTTFIQRTRYKVVKKTPYKKKKKVIIEKIE